MIRAVMRQWKLWCLPVCLVAAGCATSARVAPQRPPAEVPPARQPPISRESPAPVPAPAAPPAPALEPPKQPAADRELTALLSAMSLERRIAQRFACWVSGTEPGGRNEKLAREMGIGGIILNGTNVRSPQQVASLARSLQSAAWASCGVGLFVGVDQEGGRVTRLRFDGMSRFPPQFHWAAHKDERFVASAAYITNVEIREMGINMNFAPVLDVYPRADESVIGDRSFGADPQAVGRFGAQYIEAASRAGVVAVPKHFPGHGESDTDSHRLLPVVETTRAQLEARALAPFRAAIAAGAEAIMTAHVLYRDLDPELPATLSSRIVTDLLRGELGFKGIVVSDAIEMAALDRSFSIDSILRYAIKAGVDLILVGGRYEPEQLVALVKTMVESGQITPREIDEGVLRILRLKQKRGLLAPSAVQPEAAASR